jgi:uncharacterized protein YndB with AHSA1/START domain
MEAMTKPETEFIAEPGSHDITIRAEIPAPKETVYRAFADPDLLAQWWGPAELTTRIEAYDLAPGGSWRFVHTDPDGNEYGFRGVIHDAVPNERIVQTFEFEGMPGHVSLQTATFEDADGGTRVTQHAVFQSVADRDGMADSGARDFAPVGMAQLAEVVAKL